MAKDKEVVVYEKKINPLVERAENFEIKNADDMKEAVEMLSQLNRVADAMETEKQKVLKPLNQARTAEIKRWKPLETMYDRGISALRAGMTKFQTAETARVRAEEDKIAARVGEGKGKLKAETAIAKMDEIARPESHVNTTEGAVKFRTVKKFEVMDITMLPIEYHVADDAAIKAKMSEGVELPGVRYFEEQVPVNFR